MKIRASINGQHLSTGHIPGRGHLGAHVNLNDKQGTGAPSISVAVSGFDSSDPSETKYLKWKGSTLHPGDVLTIDLMPNAPGDEPTETRS